MKGSVAIGQVLQQRNDEGKCCDWTIIEREVLRLDKYMKGSVAIRKIEGKCCDWTITKGKCCDWTNIGRELLPIEQISEGKVAIRQYGREVLRLDNYLKGSVAIGQIYESVAIGQISEGKCCEWTNIEGDCDRTKIGREVLRIDKSKGKCCDWTDIGREALRFDKHRKGSVAIRQISEGKC